MDNNTESLKEGYGGKDWSLAFSTERQGRCGEMKAGRTREEVGSMGAPSTPIALSCCYMFLSLEDGGTKYVELEPLRPSSIIDDRWWAERPRPTYFVTVALWYNISHMFSQPPNPTSGQRQRQSQRHSQRQSQRHRQRQSQRQRYCSIVLFHSIVT
jgi:hypothetical protein